MSKAGPSRSNQSITDSPYVSSDESDIDRHIRKTSQEVDRTPSNRSSPPSYDDDFPPTPHRNDDEDRDHLLGGGIRIGKTPTVAPGGELEYDEEVEARDTSSVAERKAKWWKNTMITGVFICLWYGFATLLSLYNKWLFTPEYFNFPFPLFVTFCHMIVQFCLASLIRMIFPVFRPAERPTRKEYMTRIIPTAASTGGDIGLSNLSLKLITLSLYTMVKSSTLLFVLFFAFLFHLEPFSLRLVLVIALISFGVFLMVFNTTDISIPGLLMVFSASALGGLRWALTELVMHKKAMGLSNPFATIFWLAPVMAVCLATVSIGLEGWGRVFASYHWQGSWGVVRTGGVILLPGSMAFAMVASEYFIIQRAGVVPLSIAGIFKEVTTISISAWAFGDQLTELNIIGVGVTVIGICTYTYHKYQKSISTSSPTATHDYSNALQQRTVDSLEGEHERLHGRAALSSVSSHVPETPAAHQKITKTKKEGSSERRKRSREAILPEEGAGVADRSGDDFEAWNEDMSMGVGTMQEEGLMRISSTRRTSGEGRNSERKR